MQYGWTLFIVAESAGYLLLSVAALLGSVLFFHWLAVTSPFGNNYGSWMEITAEATFSTFSIPNPEEPLVELVSTEEEPLVLGVFGVLMILLSMPLALLIYPFTFIREHLIAIFLALGIGARTLESDGESDYYDPEPATPEVIARNARELALAALGRDLVELDSLGSQVARIGVRR